MSSSAVPADARDAVGTRLRRLVVMLLLLLVAVGMAGVLALHVAIGQVSYDDQGRARVMGQNRGHVRVYADRDSKKLIGAEKPAPKRKEESDEKVAEPVA